MKITKMSDFAEENSAEEKVNNKKSDVRKITKIQPAVKTPGRYNIFVDDKFSFSLDEVQLVKLGLKKGQEISKEQAEEYKNESDFGKSYIRAVDLISRRSRSEKEIRDYAWRKQWSKENVEKVVKRLYERGYLNDEKFAVSFLRSRANLKNYSKRRLDLELMKKGIAKDIREKLLAENESIDELQTLKNLIAKKRHRYETDQKLIAYLARQGFSFHDIKVAISEDDN
jgi:regulatory protein